MKLCPTCKLRERNARRSYCRLCESAYNRAKKGQWTRTPSLRQTARRMEVLDWLCKGLSSKQIARQLNIMERTVKAHRTALLRISKATNSCQLGVWAVERGHYRSNPPEKSGNGLIPQRSDPATPIAAGGAV